MRELIISFLTYTPVLLWTALLVLALIVEYSFAHGEICTWRGRFLNLANGGVVCLSFFFVTPLVQIIVFSGSGRMGLGFIDLRIFPQYELASQIAAGLLFLFLDDLLFYAWHRFEHAMPVLWDMHAVHHSDRAMNTTTYLRQHWLEAPLQRLLLGIPLLLMFKFTPLEATILAFGTSFFAFFTHMNVHMPLGRFSWILTGPQLHRLHHSSLKRHQDTNFAQIFPVIDRIFGTYVHPAWDEFPPTGLGSRERIETLRDTLLWPFKKWLRRIAPKAPQAP